MEVTKVEIIENVRPIPLPEPWLPAWREPNGEAISEFHWSVIRVYLDDGTIGYGPATGSPTDIELADISTLRLGRFWEERLSGKRRGCLSGLAGLEIALWDAFGKSVGAPIHELFGTTRDRVPAYAATSRLLPPDELTAITEGIQEAGFNTVKIRAHRADPTEDIEVVSALRSAVGDALSIAVDANQNNSSPGYEYWSHRTATKVARELETMDITFLEEPLPQHDRDGLARLAGTTDLSIAGGENARSPYDLKPHLESGAYDIIQPDVALDGNMGILGLRRVAGLAELFGRPVIPHVGGSRNFPLRLAATLQVAGSVPNIPLVEYPYDPPVLTAATTQVVVDTPLEPDSSGQLAVPDGPGLGIELDAEELAENGRIVWETE